MIRILLIRHGNTDLLGRVLYGRMPGVLLNAEGQRQAAVVAEALKQKHALTTVISSPLERAEETARIIADTHAVPLSFDEGVTEIHFGEWVGKSFGELHAIDGWNRFNRQRSMAWAPGGESMMEVQARAWSTIQRLAASHAEDSRIAVVTHGDVIRCILVLLLGMPLDHIHRLEIAPTSVSEILLGPHEPLVKSMNQIFY